MSQNHFTYVNTPHDPVSISGSDPYASNCSANLACWYKVDQDHMVVADGTDSNGYTKIQTIKDQSLNEGGRDLNKGTSLVPVVRTGSAGQGDAIRYLEGQQASSGAGFYLRNSVTGTAQHYNGTSNSSTWIKGPTEDRRQCPPIALFSVFKHSSDNDSLNQYEFNGFQFGAHNDGDNGQNAIGATFSLNLQNDENSNEQIPGFSFDSINSTHRNLYGLNIGNAMTQSFHCMSLVYNKSGSGQDDGNILKGYLNGQVHFETQTSSSNGTWGTTYEPGMHGTLKMVSIGGARYDYGAGYTETYALRNAWAEAFAFEDGISDIRKQQMESYLCDKFDLEMSSSFFLSKLENGGAGFAVLTSSLASPATNSGVAQTARKFVTAPSLGNNIHHETVGGGFIRSSVSGSAYYAITGSNASSSLGFSSQAWVRAEGIDDANHAGSHIALVAKASSPFGHQMDNFKGYALKYGTFKDGADTDSLKIRLSTRDARLATDGEASGFGDTDYAPKTFTPAVNEWCQVRMDVLRNGSVVAGHYPDRETNVVNIGADNAVLTAGSGSAWENLFGASSATEGAQTWSIWINTSDMTNEWTRPMIIGGYPNEEHGIELNANNGRIAWHAMYGGSRQAWQWNSQFTTARQDGNWHHILITSKMASTFSDVTAPELWWDGQKQTLDSSPSPGASSTITQFDAVSWDWDHLSIGGDGEPDESIYPSKISNAAIWNKILTDSEVAEVYNGGRITDTSTSNVASANLVGHWKMDAATGSPIVVQDETSNNNDATASNTNVTLVSATLSDSFVSGPSDGVDTIKVFARENGNLNWELLGSKTIDNSNNNFRYWKSDSGFDTSRVKAPNGIHNGYYVAMSSSNGQKLSTTYYIDDYKVMVSGSTS